MRIALLIFLLVVTGNVASQSYNCSAEVAALEINQLKFTNAADAAKEYQQYINKNYSRLTADCKRRMYSLLANFQAVSSSLNAADSSYRKAIVFSLQCNIDTARIHALIDYSRFLNSVQTDSFEVYVKKTFAALQAATVQRKFRFAEVLAKFPEGMATSIFSSSETDKLSPAVIADMPAGIKALWRQYYEMRGSSLVYSAATDTAENCLQMALFFDRNNPEDNNESVSLNNLGLLYQNMGRHTTAVEYLLAAIDNNKKNDEEYAVINNLSNVAYSYRAIKRFDVARQYAKEAVDISKRLNMSKNLCRSLSQYASVFIEEGDFEQAEKILTESIVLSRSIDNKADLCYSMRKLGHLLITNTKRQEEGKKYIDSSAYYAAAIGDAAFVYFINNSLANYYLNKGLLTQAAQQAQESYKQSVHYNDKELIAANLNLLYKIYDKQHDAAKALFYYKQWVDLKDSTLGKDVQFALADIQEKYESQKKQIAIDALQKEKTAKQLQTKIIAAAGVVFLLLSAFFYFFNRKLNRQKKQLQQANALLAEATAVQNRLFGIIGHDLKGMVAPFSRAGKIMSNYAATNNLQHAVTFSAKLEENAGRLSETLNNLLQWSLQQMKGLHIQKQPVKVYDTVQHVCSHYTDVANLKNIKVAVNIAAIDVLVTDKEALQVILRNLLSNALKFTENGTITFSSAQTNNDYSIVITDSGLGMTDTQMKNLFNFENKNTVQGTQGEGGSGLGMIVVQKLVHALGASMQINSILQQGTTITVTFNTAPAT